MNQFLWHFSESFPFWVSPLKVLRLHPFPDFGWFYFVSLLRKNNPCYLPFYEMRSMRMQVQPPPPPPTSGSRELDDFIVAQLLSNPSRNGEFPLFLLFIFHFWRSLFRVDCVIFSQFWREECAKRVLCLTKISTWLLSKYIHFRCSFSILIRFKWGSDVSLCLNRRTEGEEFVLFLIMSSFKFFIRQNFSQQYN